MKKIISLFVLTLCVFVMGCSCSCINTDSSDKKQIYASIYPVYSLTKLIVEDKMDLHMVVDPGQESHEFNPSTSTILNVIKSDLFLYLDDEMEVWASKITAKMNTGHLYSKVSNGITFLKMDESSIDEIDPHVWTTPNNLKILVNNIYELIIQVDKENQNFYLENKNQLISELDNLHQQYLNLFNNNPTFTLYFICPLQFRYLINDYKLSYKSLYVTCSEEVEPSSSDIMNFISEIRTSKAEYLIQSPYGNRNITSKFQNEFPDIYILYLDAGEKVDGSSINDGTSILDIMMNNYLVIEKIAKGDKRCFS